MRKFRNLIVPLLLVLILGACGGDGGGVTPTAEGTAETESPAEGETAAGDFNVGVSIPEAQNPFYVQLGDAIVQNLEEQGVNANLVSADSDVNEQIEGVNDLIASGIDLLLIAPLTAEGVIPAIEEARNNDIPVITYARGVADQYSDMIEAFVGFSLYESGQLKGEWVVENVDGGPIAMLLGTAGAEFSVEQAEGFRDAINASDKDFEIVFEQNSEQSREQGLQLAQDALTANPDLRVIYGSNDDMALGAVQAAKQANALEQVAILGLNGAPPATAAIAEGEMEMTVYFDAQNWGAQVADVAVQYLREGSVPEGTSEMVELVPVTQDNACQYIPPPLMEDLGVTDTCE